VGGPERDVEGGQRREPRRAGEEALGDRVEQDQDPGRSVERGEGGERGDDRRVGGIVDASLGEEDLDGVAAARRQRRVHPGAGQECADDPHLPHARAGISGTECVRPRVAPGEVDRQRQQQSRDQVAPADVRQVGGERRDGVAERLEARAKVAGVEHVHKLAPP
jgi:hypothetical protein